MRYPTALRVLTASLIMSTAVSAQASWTLDSDASQLNFQSTKMSKDGASTVEQHAFDSWRARVNDAGQLSVEIDLDSADTGIEIRDQRVSEKLFEAGDYPLETLTVDEAILRLESDDREFIVFTNRATDVVHVAYKLPEGHYGVLNLNTLS